MIKNRQDYLDYLEADRVALGLPRTRGLCVRAKRVSDEGTRSMRREWTAFFLPPSAEQTVCCLVVRCLRDIAAGNSCGSVGIKKDGKLRLDEDADAESRPRHVQSGASDC